ncbi:MAG: valine--tRNA ligase [Halobacteriota archaeon]|nr:valine--tRNA ligase [Halobacteriota archaeon]
MQDIPKEYDWKGTEEKWLHDWDESLYYFNLNSSKPPYIIDTPPPYPTGNFHVGNALNWCYIDFVARYKRMRGFNVMFPQGWDCHGLPTEVKVEEIHKITKNQVPRAEFRRLCEDLMGENIVTMKGTMKRLAFSTDWSNEYVTMDPEYFKKTQISFVRMYNQGLIYKDDHPVNWCPRCETAIAFAEVEYDTRETLLNFLHFGGIDIATTRPELLPACVAIAIHPEDERYKDMIKKRVNVPVFGHEVEIFADESVDPEFGTGAVMICTFGDKQDVKWWKEHNLPLRKALTKEGKMTALAGKYEGIGSEDCKKAIIKELKAEELIYDQEKLEQNVGLCWRCKTPLEILSEHQWFVRIDPERIINESKKIDWIPDHFFLRLKNWTESMEWDWCISRQRIFATPIPVWYCSSCGSALVAEEDELPVDPTEDLPKGVCECGSAEFVGEDDVLDTWMDSSISALSVCRWPDELLTFPSQLRPQGHDIIRTWAFYTILRTLALEGEIPWESILMNGMVLGEDGYKMSKSRNNFTAPEEVVEKYGSDAFRQWAAIGGATGSDVMFRWKDITAASRFLQKMWSILRFSMPHLKDYVPDEATELNSVDRWFLSKLNRLVEQTTELMDAFKFDETLKSLRNFVWEVMADNYLEMSKSRLYGGDPEEKRSVQFILRLAIETLSKLLAPFVPFFSEEMYSHVGDGSVHAQKWPKVSENLIDEKAEQDGELIKEITSTIRRFKSEEGIALNAPLSKVEIYSREIETRDIAGTVNSKVELFEGEPDLENIPVRIKPDMKTIGPKYRDRSKSIVIALEDADPVEIERQIEEAGKITLEIGEETIEIDSSLLRIEYAVTSGGKAADVLKIEGATVVVVR